MAFDATRSRAETLDIRNIAATLMTTPHLVRKAPDAEEGKFCSLRPEAVTRKLPTPAGLPTSGGL